MAVGVYVCQQDNYKVQSNSGKNELLVQIPVLPITETALVAAHCKAYDSAGNKFKFERDLINRTNILFGLYKIL